MNGEWYLVYTSYYNTHIRMPGPGNYKTFGYEKDSEILLEAKTKSKAILEGFEKWTEIVKERAREILPFNGADPKPRVIYKIKLYY